MNHETKLKLSQRHPTALAAFLNGARQEWRTPQGNLLPSERQARLEFFQKAATDEVVDLAGGDPALIIDAYADLTREQFLSLLVGDFGDISLEILQSS